ncbi:rRNA pseudouridine synthase [Akkermansiaceae bacterium]|nr:rRNA pseudouridine synthase [Akkermansiaceae bacterium]MDB4286415.1 rRNA pseudouridine synthase [bacterium]MDB4429255.1 rRNA pseudouridine synthase [Akkermansiaceae bacterium]MDB4507134.1 rRNA pseudouridine synthase [Akkermansiaceae bacterium]MDB4546635.1 rRNA pseudouridine synthase [Akkermansiaceae bacterium]
MSEGIRLNKYLASCGVGSRRACDAMVLDGDVVVNGQACLTPAYRVQPGDQIRANGKRIEPLIVQSIVLHKPAGLVCTRSDERQRDTIYNLLPGRMQHLMHVGRLDRDSEGLIILSNDGELSQALTHPKHKIQKLYHVTLDAAFDNEILEKLENGVYLEEGKAKAHSVKRMSSRRIEIVLTTGMKRQIRYMIQAVHHRVKRLIRMKIGQLELGNLRPGKWRPLNPQERDDLIAIAEQKR